jgi:hypothetical protein
VSKALDIVDELCLSGAKAGVQAKSADDVELHYAASNKEWTAKHVNQVSLTFIGPQINPLVLLLLAAAAAASGMFSAFCAG